MTGLILAAALTMSGSGEWVVCCEVLDTREEALAAARELDSLVTDDIDCARIPGRSSLSGSKGWLVFAGPWDTPEEAQSAACRYLWRYPGAVAARAGGGGENWETLPPVPASFDDLSGLMPPPVIYYVYGDIQPGWRIVRTLPDVGEVEEWQQPEFVTLTLPGWRREIWGDCYLGSIETRAWRTGSGDPGAEYEAAGSFLREGAGAVGAEVCESPGRYLLVHMLPDPGAREGDRDVWVALDGDSLEYGSRIRLFYGEMPYCWPWLPVEAHRSAVPDTVTSFGEAVDYLTGILAAAGRHGSVFPEGFSFGPDRLDGLPGEAWRDYFDITVREVHLPGGAGDPDTSPVVDRFRVYTRGEILWWHPLYGELVPFDLFLEGLAGSLQVSS